MTALDKQIYVLSVKLARLTYFAKLADSLRSTLRSMILLQLAETQDKLNQAVRQRASLIEA